MDIGNLLLELEDYMSESILFLSYMKGVEVVNVVNAESVSIN
jgi:hypothetical protein